jgi:type I restriction enzyme S subunit
MDFSDDEMEKLRLFPGDLLVCEGGDVGRTAIWRGEVRECAHQNHIHRLRAKDGDVESEFYMYWMQAAMQLLGLYGGEGNKTTIPNLSKARLGAFAVPRPPLGEQRRIAQVLSTIQRAIEAQEKVIAAARELKRSLMKHLFTYGPVPITETSRVPLKETEVGLVPEHWEVVELGSQVDVKGGKRLPKGHEFAKGATPYPYIRVVDFKENSVDTSDLEFLKPEDRDAIKRYIITSKDVYISIAGTIGLVGVVPPELDGANLTENAARLVIRDTLRLDRGYLALYLNSERGQSEVALRAFKTSQPKLALARIKQIPTALPPMHDQQEIAAWLERGRKKIRCEERRKAALQALFKTMLHHVMTAKIRVRG